MSDDDAVEGNLDLSSSNGLTVRTEVRRTLVLACGALARELRDIVRLHNLEGVSVECLPAALHNRPAAIPQALRAKLDQVRHRYDHIFIGYADCGTAGEIDKICAEEGIERLPGAHCYQFYAGNEQFDRMHADDPTVFYLTDFLVRNFDRLIMRGLGITAHPELRDLYFGNYTKVLYLAQTDDPDLDRRSVEAAELLGLSHERRWTGYGELAEATVAIAGRAMATS